jgi:hypothetical protein
MAKPKGALNKTSATAKENLIAVFTRLGGTAQMATWARKNQTDFYRLYARLVPQQVDLDVNIRACDVSADPLPQAEWDERYRADTTRPN